MNFSPIIRFVVTLAVFLALAVCCFAGTVYQSVALTPAQRECMIQDFTGQLAPSIPITVASFDDSLGTLDKVRLITNKSVTWRTRGENLSPFLSTPNQPTMWVGWDHNHVIQYAYRPYQSNPLVPTELRVGGYAMSHTIPGWIAPSTGDFVSAYDGVTDFGGTSGFDTGTISSYTLVPVVVEATSKREMVWWSSGATRTVYLEPRTIGEHWFCWQGAWTGGHEVAMNFAPTVIVQYEYH